jgi:hypothetical protein
MCEILSLLGDLWVCYPAEFKARGNLGGYWNMLTSSIFDWIFCTGMCLLA